MTAYREERNLRFHVGSVILVVIMGCLFHVSANEWLWLLLSIFFVLASEVWNTAIENAVDLASEYKKQKNAIFFGLYLLILCLICYIVVTWNVLK